MNDWTSGVAAMGFQSCGDCGRDWYFRRGFCPHCGHAPPADRTAAGTGTVYAATVVHRAPTKALQAHAPYAVLLVDAAEGFRFMAHGQPGLAIGDRVRLVYREFDGALLPYCQKESDSE